MLPSYSYFATALWFAAGGIVTAIFSGSLAMLTHGVSLTEVLATAMIVPSFTWVVQLTASDLLLRPAARRIYWGDLGRICLLGSVALLPAAIVNLVLPQPPLWISVTNVLLSVALMSGDLLRRSALHGIRQGWPISWCCTIALNMAIFAWVSRDWWTAT